MPRDLFKSLKYTLHHGAEAAAQTTITPASGIDMAGYETCIFLVHFGTITAGAATSIEVHTSSDDGAVDTYTALLGSGVTVADTQDDSIVTVEIKKPLERYLKCIVNRATQDSVVGNIIAIQGGARKEPVSNTGEVHLSPIEGTA